MMENEQITLTTSDIEQAIFDGVISSEDANRLFDWAKDRSGLKPPAQDVEQQKDFNLVTVAYYFGAMLMITACGWFLGDKWDSLGSGGILATTMIYFAIAVSVGWILRRRGFVVGGGLLITVAVCLLPLITYCVEDLLGFWPLRDPGAYKEYYPKIDGSWTVMEWVTIIGALIALRFVRFGFLTAPLAFSFWFFSMDFADLILGGRFYEGNSHAWVSVIVGAVTILIGYGLDKTLHKPGEPRSEDFAFWCYLFGLLAFSGGLTWINGTSELGKVLYLIVHIGLVSISLWTKRTVFLVFGAIGIHIYLGHLAYEVFKDSFLFPFVIALLGLSLILITVFAQRYVKKLNAN